jgi:hypothetical protein
MISAHSPEDLDLLFDLLDADNDELVSEEEFLELMDVLRLRFSHKEDHNKFFPETLSCVYESKGFCWFERAIKSDYFEWGVDALVAGTAVITYDLLVKQTD